ncbi:MAG: hypothetical protein ABI592_08250 [Acidobacteriota bacterium]
MTSETSVRPVPESGRAVMPWLLDSDPAIRWQVLRDLAGAPDETVASERARVASEGWGARLLALQGLDGTWGDGIARPKWESTLYSLLLLRNMGLDPASAEAQRAVGLVRDQFTWGPEFGDTRFFEGEVEPCINGGVLALGGYFGEVDDRLVDRLLGEQLEDGGWNCEAPKSRRSSFHTTICVLEGLLEREKARGASAAVTEAQTRGQEYLLARRMFRKLSTGEVIDPKWTRFSFPTNWHYDVLRGLDSLRRAGVEPDERVAEAVELVAAARHPDGRWPLRYPHPDPPRRWNNPVGFDMEGGEVEASRWNTLRALRVMEWSSRSGRRPATEPDNQAPRIHGPQSRFGESP